MLQDKLGEAVTRI